MSSIWKIKCLAVSVFTILMIAFIQSADEKRHRLLWRLQWPQNTVPRNTLPRHCFVLYSRTPRLCALRGRDPLPYIQNPTIQRSAIDIYTRAKQYTFIAETGLLANTLVHLDCPHESPNTDGRMPIGPPVYYSSGIPRRGTTRELNLD